VVAARSSGRGSHRYRCELAREAWVNAKPGRSFTRKESATQILAGLLKAWIEESNPLADQASVYADPKNTEKYWVFWVSFAL
jgi:hypothetical protein